MDKVPRRVSNWKVVVILLGVVLVTAGMFAVWVRYTADRRWTEMDREVRRLIAEARSRDTHRSALRGDALLGDAWGDYAQAIAEMEAISNRYKLLEFLERDAKADRSAVQAIIADHAVALERLKSGVRRELIQFPHRWEYPQIPPFSGSGAYVLGNLARCKARLLCEESRHREAAELLLDVCQLGRDVWHNGTYVSSQDGHVAYELALNDLRHLIILGILAKDDHLEISRELEILDRSFPRSGLTLMNERIRAGALLLQEGPPKSAILVSLKDSWRFGFSARLMVVDHFASLSRWCERAAMCEDLSWSQEMRVYEEINHDLKASANPLTETTVDGGCYHLSIAPRECRAHLRLLRVAVRYLATGEVLDLDDPFGTKLRHSQSGNKLKIWSVGPDGVDSGGDGGWGSYPPGKAPPKDIVIEVGK